jgi:hypothetical protein
MPKSRRKKRSNSKSGYIGVDKRSSGKTNWIKYRASITVGGKTKQIGLSYNTAKQAAKAFDKEAIKLRRPFSSLNFPKEAPVSYTPMQQALLSTNTVGHRGVSKTYGKFQAALTIDGSRKALGTYDTAREAAVAYDRAVLKANKSRTLLNFPNLVHTLNVEPSHEQASVARTRTPKKSHNVTGFIGVTKHLKMKKGIMFASGKFRAKIKVDGKVTFLGVYDTAEEAAMAYDDAIIAKCLKRGNRKNGALNFPLRFDQVTSGNVTINIYQNGRKEVIVHEN